MGSKQDAINDVRRKLNEVMNKNESRVMVGWSPAHVDRAEGEVWDDADGRKWTRKNGTIQNITKMDGAKTPWFCPECRKIMSHRLDTKFWRIRGKCMDCVIVEETKMRKDGTWNAYEASHVRANYIAFLKDKIAEHQDYYDTISQPEILLADDWNILMVEKWKVDIPTIKKDIQADIDLLTEELRKVESGEYDATDDK